MSDVVEENWCWNLTAVDIMKKPDLEILLTNQNYRTPRRVYHKKEKLKEILIRNHKVDDKNLIPFKDLTVKQLKCELLLRELSCKKGKKADFIQRLTNQQKIPSLLSKIPETDKLLIYGYIRQNEIVLEHGLFIPRYLQVFMVII